MKSQFINYIAKVDNILKAIGMSINREDSSRTLLNRFMYHWKCSIYLIFFNIAIMGQIVWIVLGLIAGRSLLQVTFIMPCLTLCLLGDFRLFSFIYYIRYINDLITRLKILDTTNRPNKESTKKNYETWTNFLTIITKMLVYVCYFGVATFLTGTIILMISYYYTYGEIKLMVPFLHWYPFDESDIHYWPFAFLQQTHAAWVAVNSVVGVDCFFFTCCTFIHLQFIILHEDLERVVTENSLNPDVTVRNDEFIEIVTRHRQLIRCVEILDEVYSKSTLFNVASSTLIICAAGFNLKVLNDFVLIVPFVAFLFFGMSQVSLHCYYGDCVMRSSKQVGDSIYNSCWYNAGIAVRKCLFIILLRSQKPCKFTAYGFADVNLSTFTRILSSSWSYFALLNQMYKD